MNLATLFKVALTDPGIVPRQHPPPGHSDWSWPEVYKDVVLDGVPTQLKFCDTCYFYRPPRTIHCSVCNNCVSDFDHHCPWIGNCVGRRNYTDFVVFTTLSVIDIILVVFGNVALLVLEGIKKYHEGDTSLILDSVSSSLGSNFSDSNQTSSFVPVPPNDSHELFFIYLLRSFPDCFIVTIFLIGVLIPVMMLFVLHISLICRGITTNERIKKISARKRNGMNPCLWFYTQVGLALLRGTPPSAVDGRCGVLYTVTPEEHEMQLRRRQNERKADEDDGLVAIVVVPPKESSDSSSDKKEPSSSSV